MSLTHMPFTISTATNLSSAMDLSHRIPVAVITSTAWTAADLTFRASTDGVVFRNLHDQASDTEVTVQAAADRHIALDVSSYWLGVRHLQVRSGVSTAAVTQADPRSCYLVLME